LPSGNILDFHAGLLKVETIFPVVAFKVIHRLILLTQFCKLLTTVAILSVRGEQLTQWHDASELNIITEAGCVRHVCLLIVQDSVYKLAFMVHGKEGKDPRKSIGRDERVGLLVRYEGDYREG